MAGELVLPSLEIHNFRGLRELKIERLGRANLIVGKNNVGKTSVLEALCLYARPGDPNVLMELLETRNELELDPDIGLGRRDNRPLPVDRLFNEPPAVVGELLPLFKGRRAIAGGTSPIKIGPIGATDKTLSISIEWYQRMKTSDTDDLILRAIDVVNESFPGERLGLIYRIGEYRLIVPVSSRSELAKNISLLEMYLDRLDLKIIENCYVNSSGLTPSRVEILWDRIALTSREQSVTDALCLIAPDVERLSLKPIDPGSDVKVPFVKLLNKPDPVSLLTHGDGVNRLFGIVLSLVNATNGLLLVDEIENGFHYSVLPALWKLIFALAARSNVQVFATTHSSDCVKAFQIAASENKEEEGVLIRLGRRGDRIVAVEFDEEDLEIAVEGNMELR